MKRHVTWEMYLCQSAIKHDFMFTISIVDDRLERH